MLLMWGALDFAVHLLSSGSLSGSGLLCLFLFPEVLSDEGLHVSILDGVLARKAAHVERRVASNDGGALWLHDNCGLELRDKLTSLLRKHGVRH